MILFTRNFLDCTRRLSWPVLILCGLSWAVLASRFGSGAADPESGRALGLWLHLPALLICATACAAALDAWPLLSKGELGTKQLRRLQVGPLQGCGIAVSAAIFALAGALIVIGFCFEWLAGNSRENSGVRAVVQAQADAGSPSFRLNGNLDFVGLDLRPQVALRAADRFEPARIQVLSDGEPLHEEPLSISSNGELISLRFSPRPLPELELRVLERGDFRVSFPHGSIRALSAQQYSSIVNCLLAALSYLFPASLALAALCFIGRDCSKPVCLALACAILIACTLADLTPNSAALQAYSRGQWIPSADLMESSLISLALFLASLLCAIPLRRGVRP